MISKKSPNAEKAANYSPKASTAAIDNRPADQMSGFPVALLPQDCSAITAGLP
jgi:hypothetical protein